MSRILLFTLVAALAVMALNPTQRADAACNLVSSSNVIFATRGDQRAPEGLPFRGQVGRISRAILVPGITDFVEVGADPICKSTPLGAVSKDAAGLAALFLYRRADDALVHVHVVGSSNTCANVRGALQASERNVSCSSVASDLQVAGGDKNRVRIAYPKPGDLEQPDGKTAAGAVSILVIGVGPRETRDESVADAGVHDVVDRLRSLTIRDGFPEAVCSLLAQNAAEFVKDLRGFACIDHIYRDSGIGPCDSTSLELSRVGPAYLNLGVSEVLSFDGAADFAKECMPRSSETGCEGAGTQLSYLVAADGSIHFPFDFTRILNCDDAGNCAGRSLRGSSALRRAEGDDLGLPIYLPGPEFVGSLPLNDDAPSKNPAKAGIRIGLESNDVVLQLVDDSVDQPNSVVILQPRVPVSVLCADGETACQCADVAANLPTKACVDGNTCVPLGSGACKEVNPPRYFHCDGGPGYDYNGLPCTRKEHCPSNGKTAVLCKPALCVPKDLAWTKGWRIPNNATPCELGCTADQQCGLPLFRVSTETGPGSLSFVVDDSTGKSRGACETTKNKTRCKKACGVAGDRCLGYRLEADARVP